MSGAGQKSDGRLQAGRARSASFAGRILACHELDMCLGWLPHSEARDPNLAREPLELQGKRVRFLKRTMVEKTGESTPRMLRKEVFACHAASRPWQVSKHPSSHLGSIPKCTNQIPYAHE